MSSDPTKTAQHFTTSFQVDKSPREVFAAINDVSKWWAGKISGPTDTLGGEFTYRYRDMHRSTQKVTELVEGKRIVWKVTDASLEFVEQKQEWTGTQIEFDIAKDGPRTEVRFTHRGLLPSCQCYDDCSKAWTLLVTDSLKSLITTGKGKDF